MYFFELNQEALAFEQMASARLGLFQKFFLFLLFGYDNFEEIKAQMANSEEKLDEDLNSKPFMLMCSLFQLEEEEDGFQFQGQTSL